MGKSGEPEGDVNTTSITLSKPKDPKMQAAKVHMPNGTNKDFELHRGSDGDALFTLVSTELSIEERDYFSLCFYDNEGTRHWLYNDKKILRQLKDLPWEFSFEVKFYPTEPVTLNDDNARYNLFLQLRKDVASGRLPATIPTHALLGALVAQAEYGDADSSAEYERYLRDSLKVPNFNDQSLLVQLLDRVKEVHREQKGLTANEAESKYLDACKQLSMYGVFVFDAKDKDDSNVGIGICATGVNIYKETIRVHRFVWQNIVKISYRKNTFSVKIKEGELNKKEVTLTYKVHDYIYAKRVWKCGVEHHTFFRLIQPENKPKGGLFRWGSARFRYHGRTQFQTKMASQMFDHPLGGTMPRSTSARLTQSVDHGLNKENIPIPSKSATLGRDGQPSSPVVSPGVSYDIASSKRAGPTTGKVGKKLDEDELVYTPVESPTSAAYYLSERSSLRSPYSSGAVSPHDWSAWGRNVSWRQNVSTSARRNLFGRQSGYSELNIVRFEDEELSTGTTARCADLEQIPIQQYVSMYHRGFYTGKPEEPTVRMRQYAPGNGYHAVERLEPKREMESHSIRYFVNLHHSGVSDRVRTKRLRHVGSEDKVSPRPENYAFPATRHNENITLYRDNELIPASLNQYTDVYCVEEYSSRKIQPAYRLITKVDSSRTTNFSNTGPHWSLDTVDRRVDLANLPLEHQPRVPYVSKTTVTKITTSEPEKEIRQFRYIARVCHEGDEEIVEKDQVKPELYGLPSTSYGGPLEDTNRNDELQQLPLSEHAQAYHSGLSWIKTKPSSPVKEHVTKKKAVIHLKTAPEPEEEKPEVRLVARIAPSHEPEPAETIEKPRDSTTNLFGFLKTSGKKSKSVSRESSTLVSHPSTSDRYEGPLDTVDRRVDLANLPLEHQPRVPYVSKTTVTKITSSEPEEEIRQFHYIARVCHEGDEEIVEKDQVKPELYGLPSTSYEGPLEDTNRNDELQQLPLSEHAQAYHSGLSWIKTKPSSPVKEHVTKKKAVIHLKTAPEPEEEKPEVRLVARIAPSHEPEPAETIEKPRDSTTNLFGFLKTSGKKSKSVSRESSTLVSHPSTSDRYEGPLDTVDRRVDLANLLLEHQPRVPYVSKTTVTKITTSEPEEEIRQFRYIARVCHEGDEEIVEKDQVKPELYGLPSTSYGGPLEDTNRNDELQQLPLSEHAQAYHSGLSWIKTKPSSPVKEHVTKKKAVIHLKTAPEPEEEKPEVRLVARIARSHEPEPAETIEKPRDSTTNLFGFLKTSGKKSKSVSRESSTLVSHPSTSDRYEGPLDTVDRRVDLANLPLEHQPRVPYVSKTTVTKITSSEPEEEIRQFHYIARVCHEGDEEIVEKDQVKPELYGLPSTSYEGPLEDTNRNDELQQLPLSEHAQAYHSGLSWIKTKPSSPVKEHVTKKKAVIHLKTAPEPEEEKPEVRLVARIARSHEPEPAETIEKPRDSTTNLFGFLKTSGKKSKSVSRESSTLVSHPSTSDRYEGPLDTVDRRVDLANLPLEHQPRVPYVSKTTVTKITSSEPEEEIRQFHYIARVCHEGDEEIVEKDQVKPELYGLPSTSYEGPLEDTNRNDELQQLPLSEHAQAYHSGLSWIKTKPSSPVKEHVTKKKAVIHLKTAPEPEEEKPEVRLVARIARSHEPEPAETIEKPRDSTTNLFGFLKTSGKKSKSVSRESSTLVSHPSTSDRYEGPLDTVDRRVDLANLPLEHQPRVPYVSKTTVTKITSSEPEEEIRQFHYIARVCHEGDEEIVEKDQVKPELYGLPSTSYEGPLEDTNRNDELQQLPLSEHAQAYHSGLSWIKTKPSSPVKEHVTKKKAVIHLKTAPEPEEEKPEVRLVARIAPSHEPEPAETIEKPRDSTTNLFGFLKTSGKKSKSVSRESSTLVSHPSTSDRYEGPLDTVDRRVDLANLPLEHQPRVPYVSKTTVTKITSSEPEEEIRQFHYIARVCHEGDEEIVEKDQVKPELYGLPSTSYEGPLEDTNRNDELQQLPLSEHAQAYHSGLSWIKTKPSSPVKEHVTKKKAVIHLKTAPEPEEEKPEVRLVARIARSHEPEPAETIEKPRDSTTNLFGFLKTSGKKSKSVSRESSTLVSHPSTSDRYEGPLDTVDRRVDLANLPLEHQPRVPYVSKTTVTKITSSEPEEEIRQFHYIARVCHEGDEEIVEKDQVKPELYGLPSTSYEGPLEDTNRNDELQQLPLSEHAQAYHSGLSWIKTKPSSPVKEHVTKKKAVIHLKTAPEPEEEKPEVRLVARIARSHEPEPAETIEKPRDSTTNLFGFLKTSGKKSKSVSRESSTLVSHPSTSDRYEGPLDTVDRRVDLANLPLEHQPRVPYVSKTTVTKITSSEPEEEIRQFHYIARVCHEGDEEIVEKDQVKPELYGLPSTSYEGPLEDTNRNDELQQLPLSEHAQAYHSGLSWIKTKPSSPVKEHVTKKKAVIHLKTAPEPEEEKPEVRLVARIARSHEPEPAETIEKPRDSTTNLFGFLKTSGKKSKSVSRESSTLVSHPSTSDRYEGPLDTVDRRVDLANLPLEHQPRVPYVSKTTVTKITSSEPEEEIRQFHYIARVCHEGDEEIVEKDQVKPELYGLPSTSYEGPLEDTNRNDELQQLPLSEHAQAYHSGLSWIKTKPSSPVKEHVTKKKAVIHLKTAPEPEEEKPEVRLVARIARSHEPEPAETIEKPRDSTTNLFGFLKTSGKKSKSVSRESSTLVSHPSTSDRYEGPLDTVDRRVDLANLPLEHQPRVPYVSKTTVTKITSSEPEEEIRQFHYIARVCHEGDEEIVEKDQVKPELYGLPSTSYEGPLEDTNRNDELQQLPLSEHAQAYHSGLSWIKTKPSSPVKEHVTKKKAVIHLKTAPEPEEEKPEVRLVARIARSHEPEPAETIEKPRDSTTNLFGFLKTSGKKSKSVSRESSTLVSHPSTSDRYEGPLDTVDRRVDLANLPLEHQPRVPYVSKTTVTKITSSEPEEEIRQFHYIARVCHEGDEEIVEKDQVKPELYGLPSTSYEGPLEDTNRNDELQQLPLSEHAQAYHSGLSWIKTKPSSPVKEHVTKKKAVIHLKTAPEPEEEKPEVRLVARIARSHEPEPAETIEKPRDSTTNLFGFLKTSGKKSKSVSRESSTLVSHPSTSDRYEGPLDTVDRRVDLANLPLEHQPRVPYVSKTTVTKITSSEPEEEIRQFHYIARVCHEGDEEIVEKDQVKPELYGLPSTSYEGPLEDTNRNDELQQLPLSEHAQAYHSGLSWIKTKPSSPVKEHVTKKKAVIHLKTAPEPEEEKPEVRLVARIARSHEPEPAETIEKPRDSTTNLFGFLKTSGKKSKSVSRESSTLVSHPSTSDRYEGPLDTVDRRVDLANLPLEHQPRVPYVSKTTVTKITSSEPEEEIRQFHYIARVCHEGDEEIVEKDQVKPELYGLPSTSYEGPLEDTNRNDELQQLPLSEHAQAYHSGLSWIKTKPSSPVKEHVTKKKAVIHLKTAPEPEEEKPEVRLVARIAPSHEPEPAETIEKPRDSTTNLFGFLKTSGKKSKSVSRESSTLVSHPSTSDRYEGPLDTVDRRVDLANLPLEHQPRVPYVSKTTVTKITSSEPEEEIRQFHYIARVCHEGDEEIVEKDQVKPELYGLPSTSYEGPLEDTNRNDELQQLPLSEHAQAYHSGLSWIKTKPSSPVKEHVTKKKAVIHLKTAPEPEEEKPEVRLVARIARSHEPEPAETIEKPRDSTTNLFGFLKTSGKKSKSVSRESSTLVSHPSTSDRYEGPLDTVDRRVDLANLPLEHQPRVPYVSKTTVTKITSSEPEEEIRQFHYIARVCHEGDEEIVEKDQVKPELYGLPSTSYEGPLEDTNRNDELQQLPLSEHAQAYHSGLSWIKTKPSSPVKEHVTKKKAVIHLKTAPEPEEEKPEVRLVARIAPSHEPEPAETIEKPRDSTTNLFGFLKTSGKKSKSVSRESSTLVSHPSTSDRYEGPLDTVDRRVDLANLPLEHQPRVPYVSKTTVTKITSSEPEEEIRQFHYIARVCHEGDEEIVEKDQVKPELYGLPSTSYEGPLEDTNRNDELQQLPLSEHAQAYHSGLSWIKTKPSSPVKEHVTKKKAVIHLKTAPEPEEEKPEVRLVARIAPSHEPEPAETIEKPRDSTTNLFGFFKKHKQRLLALDALDPISSSAAFHTEGVTADGQQWIEVRVERRVEVHLEPVFCLTGAGFGAVSQDEAGLIFTSTATDSSRMAFAGQSFLSRLGFKGKKKSKKTKGEHERNSSDSSSSDDEARVKVVETSPATEKGETKLEHKLVRHETKEQSYRLSGLGRTSGFNPEHPSLSTTIAEAERLNQRSPRLEHAERTIIVRALAPLPVSFEESGQPHTTVATWQESSVLPDNVTVEYDDQGNRIKRTVKTSQVKHTVQKQTFQNYTVPDESDPSSIVERTCEQLTPVGLSAHSGPIVDTQTRSVVYEANSPSQGGPESLGEFVSSKTVTSGNRTIETITYKTEHDGVVETHVEHRVTIHSEVPIDHDAELSAAILEATKLNPEFSVERIEVRQETST